MRRLAGITPTEVPSRTNASTAAFHSAVTLSLTHTWQQAASCIERQKPGELIEIMRDGSQHLADTFAQSGVPEDDRIFFIQNQQILIHNFTPIPSGGSLNQSAVISTYVEFLARVGQRIGFDMAGLGGTFDQVVLNLTGGCQKIVQDLTRHPSHHEANYQLRVQLTRLVRNLGYLNCVDIANDYEQYLFPAKTMQL